MPHFLLVYGRREGRLLRDIESFAETQTDAALARRFELEEEFVADGNVEVVLLGARSLDAAKATHSRYFKSADEMVNTPLR